MHLPLVSLQLAGRFLFENAFIYYPTRPPTKYSVRPNTTCLISAFVHPGTSVPRYVHNAATLFPPSTSVRPRGLCGLPRTGSSTCQKRVSRVGTGRRQLFSRSTAVLAPQCWQGGFRRRVRRTIMALHHASTKSPPWLLWVVSSEALAPFPWSLLLPTNAATMETFILPCIIIMSRPDMVKNREGRG